MRERACRARARAWRDVARRAALTAAAILVVGCSGGSSGEREATVNAAMEDARRRDFPDGRITAVEFTLIPLGDTTHDAWPLRPTYRVDAAVIEHGLAAELSCAGDGHAPSAYVAGALAPLPPDLPTIPVEGAHVPLDQLVAALLVRGFAPPERIDLVAIAHRPTYEVTVSLRDGGMALVDIDAASGRLTLTPLAAPQ